MFILDKVNSQLPKKCFKSESTKKFFIGRIELVNTKTKEKIYYNKYNDEDIGFSKKWQDILEKNVS